MAMPSKDQLDAFIANIHCMKPATAGKDNLKDAMKLESCLMSPEYVAEQKIDGCRYFMAANRFYSKDHVDKTENVPHLVKGFTELGFGALLLDGELNYEGRTSQYATRVTGASAPTALAFQEANGFIQYMIFDILRLPNGTWINNEPYEKRRNYLEYLYSNLIKQNPTLAKHVVIVPMVHENKREFKDSMIAQGLEGVVLKRLDSVYHFGKKPKWQWMKIKQVDATDMIILGAEPPAILYTGKDVSNWPYWANVDGQQRPVTKPYYNGWIGSLILGGYRDGEVVKLCTASGLKESLLIDYNIDPEKYIGKVAKMTFMEYTEDNNFRHPTFAGLHEDKRPDECRFDERNRPLND